MIETKEQYEWAKKADAILLQGTDVETIKSSDLIETIEALREAVWKGGRAIEYLQADPQSMETQATIMQWEDARVALPDWLTETDE